MLQNQTTISPLPEGFALRKAAARGAAEHGWLSSRHTFSFANYYDPQHMGFSDLRVINEDRVKPMRGFGEHPHHEVEIFSYVLQGTLEHRDSMGNHGQIIPGDVQTMSAGTGVRHSEFNPSATQEVHFLQIWLKTEERGKTPFYGHTHIAPSEKDGTLVQIIGPAEESRPSTALPVRQDARVYAGTFHKQQTCMYHPRPNRYTYIHVARGSISVNGIAMHAGDGLQIRIVQPIAIENGQDAEILLFDLRADA